MLFNSVQFAIFFIIVYSLYVILSHKWQNRLLLLVSYAFYAFWDWRFLSLVLTSTSLDYFCGIKIDESKDVKKKKLYLYLSICGNLSILGFFKYFNFFAYNLQIMFNSLGLSFEPRLFHIILPIGISFYTFKTLTYTMSIYGRQLKPTRNFLDYALFVAFFPTLLSGPIDRATKFLPQIISPRKLTANNLYEGCHLIFWGLFQKIFIADNLSKIVNSVFMVGKNYNGADVLIGSYAYVMQEYCDFAGYSNMAIGISKLLGFEIMNNFNLPLFAVNIADFWRRWHISLSTWVRDYIFTPLYLKLRNLKENIRLPVSSIITMTLLGLWHGAAWSFIAFGIFEGIILAAYQLIQPKIKKFKPKSYLGQQTWLITRIIFMFNVTAAGVLIFLIESPSRLYEITYSLFFKFNIFNISLNLWGKFIFFSWVIVVLEIIQYRKNNLMVVLKWKPLTSAVFYFICFYLLMIYGVEGGKEFIYFQF